MARSTLEWPTDQRKLEHRGLGRRQHEQPLSGWLVTGDWVASPSPCVDPTVTATPPTPPIPPSPPLPAHDEVTWQWC